jgi:hypothetical protein
LVIEKVMGWKHRRKMCKLAPVDPSARFQKPLLRGGNKAQARGVGILRQVSQQVFNVIQIYRCHDNRDDLKLSILRQIKPGGRNTRIGA